MPTGARAFGCGIDRTGISIIPGLFGFPVHAVCATVTPPRE
ncbi:hypothetical protein [Nocardiopsis flavescens]